MAREASSNGDKILSENYLQHADHFTRVLNERESIRRDRIDENKGDENSNFSTENKKSDEEISKSNLINVKNENDEDKVTKSQV